MSESILPLVETSDCASDDSSTQSSQREYPLPYLSPLCRRPTCRHTDCRSGPSIQAYVYQSTSPAIEVILHAFPLLLTSLGIDSLTIPLEIPFDEGREYLETSLVPHPRT